MLTVILFMDYNHGTQEIKKYIISKLNLFNKSIQDNCFTVEILEGVSSPIMISRTEEIITIKKAVSFNHKDDYDFIMKFRIKNDGDSFNLWPTTFTYKDGKSIKAEIELNGKFMTSPKIQNELIDLANTWGKALSAQEVKYKLQSSF